jgi:hypothetical protein
MIRFQQFGLVAPFLGAAIGAVGMVGSSLIGGKEKKAKSEDPPWVQDAARSAIDRSTVIADREYTPYTGQRVADQSTNERRAGVLAREGNEAAGSYYDRAASELEGMEDYSGEALQPYMNPYTDSVLQPQIREANRQYERGRSSILNSKASALGGDRAAFEASELERTHRENVSDITGRTYASAFQSAQQAFFQDQDRKTRAAAAWQDLGGDVTRMNTQQIQDLMATGGLDRLLSQADLDFDYQQFIENRDWDVTNLQPLLDSISTAKGVSRTSSTGDKAGAWGQALGAAATVAGMYFTGKQPSLEEVTPTAKRLPVPAAPPGANGTTTYFGGPG